MLLALDTAQGGWLSTERQRLPELRRERVNQDLSLLKHLNLQPDERAQALRRMVRGAAVRTHYASGYSALDRRWWMGAFYASIAAILALLTAATLWQTPSALPQRPPDDSLDKVAQFILDQAAWIILAAITVLGLQAWMNGRIVSFLGGVVAAGAVYAATSENAQRAFRQPAFEVALVEPWLWIIAAVALLWLAIDWRFRLSDRWLDKWAGRFLAGRALRPLDALALRTLRCAAYIASTRKEWTSAPRCRAWCKRLEALAVQAETAFALPARTPNRSSLRGSFRADARRLAALIRDHQRVLITAKGPEDVEDVVRSLARGAEAMLIGDRKSLLLHAKPDAPRFERFKLFLGRLVPGALLVALGSLLPQMPISIEPTIIKNIQWVLILAGIVTLVSSNKDVTARINDTFTRGVTWKS